MSKRIYIAGPISSLRESGLTVEKIKEDFERSEKELFERGFFPVSPFRLHSLSASWYEAMRADIAGLVTCDGIYLKRDWEKSPGVRLELNIALTLGFFVLIEGRN